MKTVLIIQSELPNYRNFLWEGLRKSFKLYLADEKINRLTHPNGSQTSFKDYIFEDPLDCLVLNAGIRETLKSMRYIIKYRPSTVLGWTQFVGRNKSLLSRIVKSLYLTLLYDKTLLYYDHEKSLIPFSGLQGKTVGLNNTVENWPFIESSYVDPRSILFIGRHTEKSKLTLLLETALEIKGINLHIIGVENDELPDHLQRNNFHFHGMIEDPISIQRLAASCTYFVYPGNVGLSIVHAVKLGLIPIVHADLNEHMPECRAVAQNFPIIYFQKDDQRSLLSILQFLLETTPSPKARELIASQGRKIFDQEVMISNFVKALEGY